MNSYNSAGGFMKKFIACLLAGLLVSCMSPDPRVTESSINNETFKWNYTSPLVYEDSRSTINLYPTGIQDSSFNDIYYKYAVDGDISAVKYLSENYDICFIDVINKNKSKLTFDLSKLKLVRNKKIYNFISPLDIPSRVKRLNPKGITKNVYNTVVIIAVTAAIIALCQKSHSAPSIPSFSSGPDFSINSGASGSDNKYGIFSSFFHKTKYHFSDCILESNIIQPLSNKTGIVFIKKGALGKGKTMIIYE